MMKLKVSVGVSWDHSLPYIPSTNLKYKIWPSAVPLLAKHGIWSTKLAMGLIHSQQL